MLSALLDPFSFGVDLSEKRTMATADDPSRNTALILVSQNAGDLLSVQVTNCLSGVFTFRFNV
jgi:hypothetical protein